MLGKGLMEGQSWSDVDGMEQILLTILVSY